MATTYRRIESDKKAFEILDFLGQQKGPVPGSEIARATNMPVATAMSHLATMGDINVVRQIGDGWELGMRMPLLWARYKSNLEARRERINQELETLTIPGGN
ncbi:MAG: helix-turn-helix domain-containing protein [Geobacteraceae bacterium]|nr:helix-turn-helix domain-containing protein [Geobacteraceae bacterium]